MKGDFSRDTFAPHNDYSRVMLQQGRVQLDADFNEQAAIIEYLMRTQLSDLLGASGTMLDEGGFEIHAAAGTRAAGRGETTEEVTPQQPAAQQPVTQQPETQQPETQDGTAAPTGAASRREMPRLVLRAGRYYVDGILCRNGFDLQLDEHPHLLSRQHPLGNASRVVAFLDVWERHLTACEEPSIRDVALSGADTSTRVRTEWQIGFLPLTSAQPAETPSTVRGTASTVAPDTPPEPVSPVSRSDARARALREVTAAWDAWPARHPERARLEATCDGLGMVYENRLYRVEVHDPQRPSFKWSRDNGSVAFRIAVEDGVPQIHVGQPGELHVDVEYLAQRGGELNVRDLVEISDDESIRTGRRRALCQIDVIDVAANKLILLVLSSEEDPALFTQQALQALQNPVLTRWDHAWPPDSEHYDGAITVVDGDWLPLENGIKVRFTNTGALRAGDYWSIPARAERDGIEWPAGERREPEGVHHHYSPLAILRSHDGTWEVEQDVRPTFFRQVDLPGTLAELESRLRDEQDTTRKQLEKRIDALEETLRLKRFHSRLPMVNGQFVARVAGTNDQVELVDAANARLVAGVVAAVDKQSDTSYRVQVQTHGEQDIRVVGLVSPGDLLVPSDCPGHVCRAGLFIRPGTLIAKAITPHQPEDDETQGTIRGVIIFG